ncbi:MAG TPA: alpha/beta hydrolase [Blastocatellia bacterium]|nr:alpha/beta hydrolase [Blastocatellia bacterium]
MRLHAKVIGESHPETILFIPGLSGSHSGWDENFQALGRSHRLVLIDTLGFGHSPKPDLDYTLDDHLSAVSDTLTELGVSRVHLVGHSMGTLLGLAFAHRFPERVDKMALLALPWFQSEVEARRRISHSSLFHRLLAMDTPLAHTVCQLMCALRPLLLPVMPYLVRDVPPMVAQDVLRHTWFSYSRTLRNVIFRAETTKWMRETTHPILLIHGRRDRTAPLQLVKENLAALDRPGPAGLIELDADHGLIFTHSREIAAAVSDFLSSAPGN